MRRRCLGALFWIAACGSAALAQRPGTPPPEVRKPFRFDSSPRPAERAVPTDKPIPRAIPVERPSASPAPAPAGPTSRSPGVVATPKPLAAPELEEPGTIRMAPSTTARPADQIQLDIADSFYAKKQFDQAAPEYERYLGLYPNGADRATALFRLAESYRRTGSTNAAKNSYEMLLSQFVNGDFIGPAAYRLGELYYQEKQYRDALPLFRKASVRLKDPAVTNSAKFYVGRSLEALGQKLDARLAYEELTTSAENNPFRDASRLSLALLFKDSGRVADALKQAQALAKETDNPELKIEAMVRAGLWLIDLEQAPKAEKQFRDSLELPGNSKWKEIARLGLLRLQFDAGKYEEVYSTYRTSQGDFSAESRPDLLILVANAARQLGKNAEARTLYDQIIHDFPSTAVAKDALFARLKLLYYSDDPSLVAEIDSYLLSNPEAAERDQVMLMKAEAFYKKSDYQNALPLYSALELSRTLTGNYKGEALFKLGFCYVQLRDLEHGIKAFTAFIEQYPTNKSLPYALIQRALAYQEMKNLTPALKDFDQVITRFPKAREREIALQHRALILGQQGDNAEMVSSFKTLLKEFPDTAAKAQANYWVGWAAYEAKDYKGAIAPLRIARELDKETLFEKATFRILLAVFNLENLEETAKEVEIYAKDGKEKVPAQILRWLGTELYKQGRFPDSEKYFTMITPREEATPDDFLFLGRSRLKMGQPKEAADALKDYLTRVKEPIPRATGLLDLVQASIGTHDLDAAQKAADEVLTLQPEGPLNGEGRIAEGDVLVARDQFEAAAKMYRAVSAVIDEEAVTPRALEKAIAAYKKAGNEAEAKKTLNLLQSRYPEYMQRKEKTP